MIFGGFAAILFLIDFVEQIRRFSGMNVSFGEALQLSALNSPAAVYRILPLIMILSAIALFLGLARSSEMVVIRAAGRSALRMLISPVLTALALGGLSVAVLNPIVAATTVQYEAMSARFAHGVTSTLSISREGLWLRQGSVEGQTVIRAQRSNFDGTELTDVTFFSFSPQGTPLARIEARSAVLRDSAWSLQDAKKWLLTDQNPERTASAHETLVISSDLTADQIRDSFGEPATIAIWELPEYITSLERAGFSSLKHDVWYNMELALPLLLASMVLIGAGFTLRHARFGRTGIMVLMAVGMGFAIFFLRNFAQILGENGQIPVILAAWSPPVAAILLSLGLLLHLEDG